MHKPWAMVPWLDHGNWTIVNRHEARRNDDDHLSGSVQYRRLLSEFDWCSSIRWIEP